MGKGATVLIVDLGLLVGVGLALQGADRRGPVTGRVVFVCEHGAAKSVVAAAHFNRLAEERGLLYRAVAKGTDPQPALSPTAVDGLRVDGLEGAPATPERVKVEDLARAARVVSFGCDLSKVAPAGKQIERWEEIPPVGENYAAARTAILERVKVLLDELAKVKR
jgi:protein-tyrosine-phosphatase